MSNETELQKLLDSYNQPPVPLHPDLTPWLFDGPLGPMLKHPLVYAIIITDQEHARYNAMYEAKLRAYYDACAASKWNQAVFLYERPWRLDAFKDIQDNLTDDEYWPLLGQIWTDSENIYQNRDNWAQLLTDETRTNRHLIMSDEERDQLAKMPDTGIHVYRGYTYDAAADGLSWTLNKDRARWFAKRFPGGERPRIVCGTIDRKHVIAHFTGRGEDEVVLLPGDVKNWTIEDA